MWNLPRPGIEPMSPELAGWFLSTAPADKSSMSFLFTKNKQLINKDQVLLKQFLPIGRATGGDIMMGGLWIPLAVRGSETRELPTSLPLTWSYFPWPHKNIILDPWLSSLKMPYFSFSHPLSEFHTSCYESICSFQGLCFIYVNSTCSCLEGRVCISLVWG